MRKEGSQYAFEVTYRLAHVIGDEIHHLIRQRYTVPVHFGEQDSASQVVVRSLNLRRQSPFEACEEPLLDLLEFNRRTVRGQDKLLATLLQVIENMEERVLCSFEARKILNIIHNQHIHGLIEIEEIGYAVVECCVLVLQFERVGTDVQHSCLRVIDPYLVAYGIRQMGLSYSATAVDKQRIEGRITGLFGDRHTRSTRQLIGLAAHKRIKGIERIELGVEMGYKRLSARGFRIVNT